MDCESLLSGLDDIAEAYKKRGHDLCDLRDMNPKIMQKTLRDFVRNCSTFDQDMQVMNIESRKRFCKSSGESKISTRMRQLNLKQNQNGSGESKNRNSPESVDTEESQEGEAGDNMEDFAIGVARASWHLRNLIFRRESGAITESKRRGNSSYGEFRGGGGRGGFGRVDSSEFLGLADVDISRGKLGEFDGFSDLYTDSSLTDFHTSGSGTNTSMTKTPSSVSLKSFSGGSGGEFSDGSQGRSRAASKSSEGEAGQAVSEVTEHEPTSREADIFFVADFEGEDGSYNRSDSKDSNSQSHKSRARSSPDSSSTTSSSKRRKRSM